MTRLRRVAKHRLNNMAHEGKGNIQTAKKEEEQQQKMLEGVSQVAFPTPCTTPHLRQLRIAFREAHLPHELHLCC